MVKFDKDEDVLPTVSGLDPCCRAEVICITYAKPTKSLAADGSDWPMCLEVPGAVCPEKAASSALLTSSTHHG